MPIVGEISKTHLGQRQIWMLCSMCKSAKWVLETHLAKLKTKGRQYLCRACWRESSYGEQSSRWRGGRVRKSTGYTFIKLYSDDFFYPMANKKGYVLEHRLVVAKALNRCLLPWETVHHKGAKYPLESKENKSDNRYPENLELLKGKHNPGFQRELKRQANEIKLLQERVTLLEAENIVLRKTLIDGHMVRR